jgi:hypothetical protein
LIQKRYKHGSNERKFIWMIYNRLASSFCESDENSLFYMLSNFWHDDFWKYVNNIFIRKVKHVYNIGIKFPHYFLNYCVKSLLIGSKLQKLHSFKIIILAKIGWNMSILRFYLVLNMRSTEFNKTNYMIIFYI